MASSQKPIANYLLPFLDYCEVEKGLSDETQRNYRHYLAAFIRWLKETDNQRLRPSQFSSQHAWDYRLYLARKHRTPTGGYLTKKSQNFYLIALRALLRYFAERDIESLPSSKINLAKQETEGSISFLEEHEIERILECAHTSNLAGLRDRAVMETFFSSGMRISELISLNVHAVSVLAGKKDPNRTLELSIIGKGKRARTVFLSPRACGWIRAYLAERGPDDHKPLFINSRTKNPESRRLSARGIQAIIARYARAAGLAKKVTPHTLRHSYATSLLSRGTDLRRTARPQECGDHANLYTRHEQTLARYP